MGSGIIAVAGPSGCGKSFAVLQYIAGREKRFSPLPVATSSAPPHFQASYFSAGSFHGDGVHRITAAVKRDKSTSSASSAALVVGVKRSRVDTPSSELSRALIQWVQRHGEGSELHLVIDDADCLPNEEADISGWLDGCNAQTRRSLVLLWLLSPFPRLSRAYRVHVLSRQPTPTLHEWWAAELDARLDAFVASSGSSSEASASHVKALVLQTAEYFSTRQPMKSSITVRDPRWLMKLVWEVLPTLLSISGGGKRKLNALDLAKVWSRLHPSHSQRDSESCSSTPYSKEGSLASSLYESGFSAVLLALAAFFCGALPADVVTKTLSSEPSAGRRTRRGVASSHRPQAAISSSTFTFAMRQWVSAYQLLLPICTAHIDPLEFSAVGTAVRYHLPLLIAQGVVSTSGPSQKAFHCWMSIKAAERLSGMVQLDLYQMLPV